MKENQPVSRLVAVSLVLAMVGCGSGLPTQPLKGVLYFEDTGAVVHEYRVTEADFNEYSDDDGRWITIYVSARNKISPSDSENQEPWLEINMWFAPAQEDAVLGRSAVLVAPSYDDTLGNLTNFYHWEHVPLEDAKVEVIDASRDRCLVQISGKTYDGPLVVKTDLHRNSKRERSFS